MFSDLPEANLNFSCMTAVGSRKEPVGSRKDPVGSGKDPVGSIDLFQKILPRSARCRLRVRYICVCHASCGRLCKVGGCAVSVVIPAHKAGRICKI